MDNKKELRKIREKNLKKKKEYKRARDSLWGMILAGGIFSAVIGYLAADLLAVDKAFDKFEYYINWDLHHFSWNIFFLVFFATFVPIVAASVAAQIAIDCVEGVAKNEDEEKLLHDAEQEEKEKEKRKQEEALETNKILDEAEKK